LSPGELASTADSGCDRFVQCEPIFDMREKLPVTERLASGTGQATRPSRESPDLVLKTRFQHRREALLDTSRYDISRQPDTSEPPGRRRKSPDPWPVTRKRPAAANCHL
jgi:hypothetical protein